MSLHGQGMHLSLFVHADAAGTRATVSAHWMDATGSRTASLMQNQPIPAEADERNPWALLAGLYAALRDVKAVAVDDPDAS